MGNYPFTGTRYPPTCANGLPFMPGVSYSPAGESTLWAGGGIPARTTIFTTVSPSGDTSGATDKAAVKAAHDACPANQTVLLASGTPGPGGTGQFYFDGNVLLDNANTTVRGGGPGAGWKTGIGTFITMVGAAAYVDIPFRMARGADIGGSLTSFNLFSDGAFGSDTVVITGTPTKSPGDLMFIDMDTCDTGQPNFSAVTDQFWSAQQTEDPTGPHDGPTPPNEDRHYFIRYNRAINQLLEVKTCTNNSPSAGKTTFTFYDKLNYDFTVARSAQLCDFAQNAQLRDECVGIGLEEMYIEKGGNGGFTGNFAAFCWAKHIEVNDSVSASGFSISYRCELRDSFIHDQSMAHGGHAPGGAGYMTGIGTGSTGCLSENTICWNGEKPVVMQGGGPGNVQAYNYYNDMWNESLPDTAEAGANCGHSTATHHALLEGVYAHDFKGDTYWGNSFAITSYRCQFSALRASARGLDTYVNGLGIPYGEYKSRHGVDLGMGTRTHNFLACVIGKEGQTLLSKTLGGYSATQTAFQYEEFSLVGNTSFDSSKVTMWRGGREEAYKDVHGGTENFNGPDVLSDLVRDGCYDYFTGLVHWHGVGGSGAQTTPPADADFIPSLYLTSKPAFLGTIPWPCITPEGSTKVAKNQAQLRFEAGRPNDLTIFTEGSGSPPVLLGQACL